MDSYYDGGHDSQDAAIEYKVRWLEEKRTILQKRVDAIIMDVYDSNTSSDATICEEYRSLEAEIVLIYEQIGKPNLHDLWTSDETAAWVCEEDLASAKERVQSAESMVRNWQYFLSRYTGSQAEVEELTYWQGVVKDRKAEVLRIEDLLVDNPASGWIPF
jgi:hypothetical protein